MEPIFTVSLEGLNLKQEQLKRIDAAIKDAVMRELASIDTEGDLAITRKVQINPTFKGIKLPEWFGIWVMPVKSYSRFFK